MAGYNCMITLLLAILLWIKPTMALADTIQLYAAGSLRGTLAAYAMPPERKPKAEHRFGAALRFPTTAKPGIYQVTLSKEARLDIAQDCRYARAVWHSGRNDRPGLRKSARLELDAAPFVLQISSTDADTITVAVSPAE